MRLHTLTWKKSVGWIIEERRTIFSDARVHELGEKILVREETHDACYTGRWARTALKKRFRISAGAMMAATRQMNYFIGLTDPHMLSKRNYL